MSVRLDDGTDLREDQKKIYLGLSPGQQPSGWCLSVWAVPGKFFQSLPVPCGDKQGRAGWPGQPLRGVGRGAISIKEILGENRGTCI
jgi:hypothetical protein